MSERAEKKNNLTKRQREIIRVLVQMGGRAITVAAIAEKLDVSKRTILREIPTIEGWMEENDFIFVRRPGVGISLDEEEENLQLIEELLGEETPDGTHNKQERQSHMLGMLLFADEPLKSYYLTTHFGISESTLFADLDRLEEWLVDYQINLIRKPGSGIVLECDEFHRRQAIANGAMEFCQMNQVMHAAGTENPQELKKLQENPLLCFWQLNVIQLAKIIVDRCEKGLNVSFADAGKVGLMLRVGVAIYRIQSGITIKEPPEIIDRISVMAELSMARTIAEIIHMMTLESKGTLVQIPEAEVDYLAMAMAVTRVKNTGNTLENPIQLMDVHTVIMSMVSVAEQLTELPLRNDRVLIEDLTHHVLTMTRRASMEVMLSKPEIDDLRERYPGIYAASEVACKGLAEWITPYEIRESDQGYIAMHFIAAAIRIEENNQKIAVAVVCPAGIASSRMLASGIRQKFPTLEVKKIISAFSLGKENLEKEGIELLISTVKLVTDFPYVEVDKILQANDQARIQNEIDRITQNRLNQKTVVGKSHFGNRLKMEDVKKISDAGIEIRSILDQFGLWELESVTGESDLIDQAAFLMADENTEDAGLIRKGFYERESYGSTFIRDMNVFMLHCRAAVEGHSRFGYIRLQKPLDLEQGRAEGAICMFVPEKQKDSFYLDIIGRFSELLVEDDRFLAALKQGDKTGSVSLAEEALLKYFQQLIN